MRKADFITKVIYKGGVDRDSYLWDIPAVRYIFEKRDLQIDNAVTIIMGENGSGKSTLLEGIAAAAGFNPEGGTRNFDFSTRATHSSLFKYLTLARKRYPKDGYFLRAESFYNTATYIDEIYSSERRMGMNTPYGSVSLHDQSHGESFMTLITERFRGDGLYILDEPEAALSPMRIMELIVCIHELAERGAQFIIATHSPMIMAYPGADVLELSEEGVHSVDYRDTKHFNITREFLNDPERMMRYLLEE